FHNESDGQGGRRFAEAAVSSGVGYADDGSARAGMGIDCGEDRPGRTAILLRNFADESNSFLSLDDSYELSICHAAAVQGIAAPSRSVLKFGVFFFDFDLDGRQDFLTCNGHLAPEIGQAQSNRSYAQPAQLFWNSGMKKAYVLVDAAQAGPDLFRP